MSKKIIIGLIAFALVFSGYVYWKNYRGSSLPVLVTSSGVWYRAGNMLKTNPPLPLTVGRMYSTTTNQAAVNLLASELNGYSVVRVYASTSDVTITLPATSTLSTFIPTAGDNTEVIFKNASTTAGIDVGLLVGTGMTFHNATNTATTTQDDLIVAKFIRKTNTDIDVYLNVGI